MKERAARLLSGKNVPSVLERESLARSVLEDSGAKQREPRTGRRVATGLIIGAAGVFLVVTTLRDELVPRSGHAGTTFETICRPGPDCRVGGQLMFRLSNAPAGFDRVAIFAQRPDGLVIWYFPANEHETSTAFIDSEWMEEGVELVGAHDPGLYVVHAVVSAEPMTRAMVRERVALGSDDSHELLRTEVMLNP